MAMDMAMVDADVGTPPPTITDPSIPMATIAPTSIALRTHMQGITAHAFGAGAGGVGAGGAGAGEAGGAGSDQAVRSEHKARHLTCCESFAAKSARVRPAVLVAAAARPVGFPSG